MTYAGLLNCSRIWNRFSMRNSSTRPVLPLVLRRLQPVTPAWVPDRRCHPRLRVSVAAGLCAAEPPRSAVFASAGRTESVSAVYMRPGKSCSAAHLHNVCACCKHRRQALAPLADTVQQCGCVHELTSMVAVIFWLSASTAAISSLILSMFARVADRFACRMHSRLSACNRWRRTVNKWCT